MIDPRSFGLNIRVITETEIDNTGVWVEVLKNEVAEVTIVGDEDAALAVRDRKHLAIRQSCGVVACDSVRIVAKRMEMTDKACV